MGLIPISPYTILQCVAELVASNFSVIYRNGYAFELVLSLDGTDSKSYSVKVYQVKSGSQVDGKENDGIMLWYTTVNIGMAFQ